MRTIDGRGVMLQAHRGVASDCPENTMAAFRAAVEQGYDVIELDPKFTKDNVCVVLHDGTVGRTGRTKNGGAAKNQRIAEMTYAGANALEYGGWFSEAYRGEALPLMEDVLSFAVENGIPLKIDNVIESFTEEQTEILFSLVEKAHAQGVAGFTCTKEEYIRKAAARFPDSVIHYDGPVDEGKLKSVAACLQNNPLTVWLPCPNRLTAWCTMPQASHERVQMVRGMGAKLGLWILEDEDEFVEVCARFAPDVVETTGMIKPDMK